MSLTSLLVIIALGLAGLLYAMFPGVRVLVKGLIGVFIKDMAATPEGARAVYEEKIKKAQESYNKADDAYKKAAGRLSTAEDEKKRLESQLKKCEKDCEALVQADKMEEAQLKAEEREDILSALERNATLIVAFRDAEATAKEAYDLCSDRLRKLKKEAKEVVENMKVKSELKEVYDDTDELKAITETDRLLESVREKNQNLNEIVEGSRVVHNNRASTKLLKADQQARMLQSNDYLESLKNKYQKEKVKV